MIRKTLLALLLTSPLAAPSFAQTETELVAAFTGDWLNYELANAVDGKACTLSLTATAGEHGYDLRPSNCGMELAQVTHWSIVEGQMILKVGAEEFAALGGTQDRVSGDTIIGAPLVLDRAGAGTGDNLRKARGESGCFYQGFTSTCIDDRQTVAPQPGADGTAARITLLVNLNVRTEARDSADVLGVVSAGTCVITETCIDTADGPWCRAKFGETQGWLKKLALRQDKWPVVTYTNQCES